MTGLATRPLERVVRRAVLGLRFLDVATGESAVDGLRVEVFPRADRRRRARATPGPSGIYTTGHLPGLHDAGFADGDADDDDPAAVSPPPTPTRPYRVEVDDPEGRYLPIAFDADLPSRELVTWFAPWLSPPRAVAWPFAPGALPSAMTGWVPLFSAPTRPPPDPLAVVRAQLAEQGTDRPLAWALLAVSIAGERCGVGLADAQGRVAVLFPYPEPQRAPFASPPPAQDDVGWDLDLTAFGASTPPGEVPAAHADLAEVIASVAAPRVVVLSTASPPPTRPRLAWRRSLVLRTAGGSGAAASSLFVS